MPMTPPDIILTLGLMLHSSWSIKNCPRYLHGSNKIYSQLITLESRRHEYFETPSYYQAPELICKCVNSIDPNNLGDVLKLRDVCYNQRIREVINLVQPYFNTEWMHKFCSFTANLASCRTSYRSTL